VERGSSGARPPPLVRAGTAGHTAQPRRVNQRQRFCSSAGSGSGAGASSWSTARKRVDNYAAGFLKARAAVVLSDGHSSLANELAYLFGKARSILGAWRADPGAHGHERAFSSLRSPGFTTYLDPDRSSTGFYRSLVTKATASTRGIRVAAMRGLANSDAALRSGPSGVSTKVAGIKDGQRLIVTGPIATDARGRTWSPVITLKGQRGFIAGWLAGYGGTAVTRTSVVLRSSPSTKASKLATIRTNTRVTIRGSRRDASYRVWLSVRTASGATGWMASWFMRP